MLTAFTMGATAKDYTVASPDGKLVITIHADQQRLTWEVQHGKTIVLAPSEIGLNGAFQKMNGKVTKHTAVVSNKQFSVEFRADNDAAAYRIHVSDKKGITVNNETAEFNFASDYNAFIPYVNDNRGGERYCFSFESYYDEQPLSKMFKDSLAINPLAVRLPEIPSQYVCPRANWLLLLIWEPSTILACSSKRREPMVCRQSLPPTLSKRRLAAMPV